MKIKVFILFLFVSCLSCRTDVAESANNKSLSLNNELTFNKEKWRVKDGKDYPYRAQMLNDVVYNDTIRTLNKKKILNLLGKPDRTNENHLYYMISQKRLGFWPLHTKMLVVKFKNDHTIHWIKIYE